MIKNSIFIPIAACEERFIEQTVRSALLNADNPDNVYFGIFNNIINPEHSLLGNSFIVDNPQIFYVEVVSPAPLGTGAGRMNASLLQFDKFEYSFQVDSHNLFPKNWDTQLIDVFNKIKDDENIDENKIVLSGSLPLFWTYDEENPNNISMNYNGEHSFKVDPMNLEESCGEYIKRGIRVNEFYYNGMQAGVYCKALDGFPTVYGGDEVGDSDYKESAGVIGAFMFSKANLCRDVLHDPEDPWSGDQTNYSIRLLSRGYRIFAPKYPSIATLNKYKTNTDGSQYIFDMNHNWKTIDTPSIGSIYTRTKIHTANLFFSDMISGKYFGYWGAQDPATLIDVKKKINYPEPKNQ